MGHNGRYTGTLSHRACSYYMPRRCPERHIESTLAFSLVEANVTIVVPFFYDTQHMLVRYLAYEHEEASLILKIIMVARFCKR